MCFKWPLLYACLMRILLSPMFISFLYSIWMLDDWFLSLKFASIPELIFYKTFQWTWFIPLLSFCFVENLTAYMTLIGLWTYKIFIVIIIDPDNFFHKRSSSAWAFNRYQQHGYTPAQAYSRKYMILSYYQLHEYINNGYCDFFNWFGHYLEK